MNRMYLKRTQGEDYLWRPDIQETKVSQYGGINIRYNWFYREEVYRGAI